MPRVSAIVPCYNGAHFLPDALDSALAQTFADYELLVIDDGSTDNTAEVAGDYSARHPGRVRYIHQENKGLAVARNTAIAAARGDLLALLDCDDLWMPERLAEGVRVMDACPEVGLLHADIVCIDADRRPLPPLSRDERFLSGRIFEHIYTRRAHVSCPTVLFRRECVEKVGGFDPELTRLGCEDRDLWLRIARHWPFAYIPRPMAQYRITPGSMSRNREKMMKAKMYVLEKHAGASLRGRMLRREALAGVYQEMAELSTGAGEPAEARRWWLKTLATCPWRRRYATLALKSFFSSR
jgi:glycosyltransferase involved in cell wall biosynthesis